MTAKEADLIRGQFIREVREAMAGLEYEPQRPELHFRNSSLLGAYWFLLSAEDKVSRNCLLILFIRYFSADAAWLVEIAYELRNRTSRAQPNYSIFKLGHSRSENGGT